ncbi:MAG: EamA family transporter [Gaiellales bacterium]|nr:EamA family transporter [Gaiellales bacterium]
MGEQRRHLTQASEARPAGPGSSPTAEIGVLPATDAVAATHAAPAGRAEPQPATPAVPSRRDAAFSTFLVVAIGVVMQAGSALAVRVIDSVGVIEALWLRTVFAAAVLAALRPRSLRLPARGHRLGMLWLVISLLGMNLCFYEAISRAPVGIVVAVEFVGPLTLAVAGSRRALDILWVVLAAAGIAVLANPSGSAGVVGILFSLASGAFWALYLLLAKRTAGNMDALRATTLMLAGSSLLLTPFLLASGVRIAGQGRAILLGLAVAMLSSAIPYFLEITALQRVRASTYSVLLSIEPAIAALMGFLILAQPLSAAEIGAIVAIAAAAAGAGWAAAGRAGSALQPM